MEYLKVENVGKTYVTGEESFQALSGISFTIDRGEFVAVMGPSGCGKSTLLHILGGLDSPTFGCVRLNGSSLYEKSEKELAMFRRREAGIVYQFYNLVPELTAEENLLLPAFMNRVKPDGAYVDEILKLLGMRSKRHFYPDMLSGGQQQKIAIGRALVQRPSLLLADEPTGNLDSVKRDEVLDLFSYLNKTESMTIMLVTHDDAATRVSGRKICLFDGKIASDSAGLQAEDPPARKQ